MKAVVIFNLGGPKTLKDVKPFLFNLFYDPEIINLPNPFRYLIAKLVSSRREKTARDIYSYLGGGSPILQETQMQAKALQTKLGDDYHVYVCMRYWHPQIQEVMNEIKGGSFEKVILLPLYPQFSLSTTGSFFRDWDTQAEKLSFTVPTEKICCYPADQSFVDAYKNVICEYLARNKVPQHSRFLFSAHGLPLRNIENGDPYQRHVESSVQQIVNQMPEINDYKITYQSKVGPLKWLEPSTEDEIKLAAKEGTPVVIVPISFVSENSETLYELDYQYKQYAHELGLKEYFRVPTVQANDLYIETLANQIKQKNRINCSMVGCNKYNILKAA